MSNTKKIIIWALATPFILAFIIFVAAFIFVYTTVMKTPEHYFQPPTRDIPQLQQMVETDPSCANLTALAKAYRHHGQTEQWRETIELAEQKASNTDHVNVRQELVVGLIGTGEWEKADEYIGDPPKKHGWEELQQIAWFYGGTGRAPLGLPYVEMDADRCHHDSLTTYLLAFQIG